MFEWYHCDSSTRLNVAQTKANESANTNTYHKWKSCLCKAIVVTCPFTSLFLSISSFYHELRNKPWADFHFVWNTGPIQGTSSTRHSRTEHNGILLLLLCIYVSIVWLCWHVFLHMQFDAVYSVYLLRGVHSTLENWLKNPIQSNPFIVIFARLDSTYYAVYTTRWTFIVTFPKISHVVLLIVFVCALLFLLHSCSISFFCCCFFNRFVFG